MIRKGSKYTFKRVELSILFKLVSRPDIFLLQYTYHNHLVEFFSLLLNTELRKSGGKKIHSDSNQMCYIKMNVAWPASTKVAGWKSAPKGAIIHATNQIFIRFNSSYLKALQNSMN